MTEAQLWLEFAKTDLSMVELALPHELYGQGWFPAHQCVEKALKAAILGHRRSVSRTHSLMDLAHLAQVTGFPKEMQGQMGILDKFYMPTRYPDDLARVEDQPGPKDAEETRTIALKVWEWAKEKKSG